MEFSLSIFDYTFTNYDDIPRRPATAPVFPSSGLPQNPILCTSQVR